MVINMVGHPIDSYTLLNQFIHAYPHDEPRYERKFRLRISDGQIAFQHLLNLGFSPIYDPRQINSIYFDTTDYQFARENINGERYRVKPRLRWYGNQNLHNDVEAFLEYKFRDGFLGYKYRKKIVKPLSEYQRVASTIENDLFSVVSPAIQIGYERHYFFHPSGVRATVDTNLFAGDLRSSRYSNFISIGYDVVEFKYPFELDNHFRECIFSKFSELAPYRINKSSKYVEGLIVCQCLFG